MLNNNFDVTIHVINPGNSDLYDVSSYPHDGLFFNMTGNALVHVDNGIVNLLYLNLEQLTKFAKVSQAADGVSGGLSEDFVLKAIAVARDPNKLVDAVSTKSLPETEIDPNTPQA